MSSKTFRIAIALSVLIATGVFALTLHDALRYPGADLRSKVVGARLLLAHLNPYPDLDQPEPNERYRMFKEDTYSPALLALYGPLSRLPYGPQRMIYFAFDWLAVAFLFWRTRTWFTPPDRGAHCAFFLLLVVMDYALRLHIELGQYYLAMAALGAVAISAWRKNSGQSGWTGPVALGLLLLIRPTFLIVLPVLWLQGFRQPVRRTMLTFAVFAVLMLAAFGTRPWNGYLTTIRSAQTSEIASIFTPIANSDDSPATAQQASAQDAADSMKAEGYDFSLQLSSNYAVSRASVGFCAIQKTVRPGCARLFKTAKAFTWVNDGLLLLAALYCLSIAYLLRNSTREVQLGFALLTPIILESFGPQRYAYCDVTLAPVLMLILAIALRGRVWQRGGYRAAAAVLISVCLLSSIAPYVLSPAHKPVMVFSLCRWIALFVFANVVFVKAASFAGARASNRTAASSGM